MSKNLIRRGPDYTLLDRIETIERTLLQMKSNQPTTVALTNSATVNLGSPADGTRSTLTVTFTGNEGQRMTAFPEITYYLGTVDVAHSYEGDVTATYWPNRNLIYRDWRYDYQQTDGLNSKMLFEIKNHSGTTLTNLIAVVRVRYPNASGTGAAS